MGRRNIIFFFLLFIFYCNPLFSAIIYLSSGEVIEGKIIEDTSGYIKVKRKVGKIEITMIYFKENIKKIELSEDRNTAKKEAVSAFREYRRALGEKDYERAFSLEPGFIQAAVGSVETYKKLWSGSPRYDVYRQLYSRLKIKEIKVLTPRRVAILVTSPDERISRAAFYMMKEYGEWKVGGFEHVFLRTEKELVKLKNAIMNYYNENKSLPRDLYELVPKYIEALPIDLFNDKGEPYRYIKLSSKNFVIYSFGPDSDDDLGKVEYHYENGLLSNGDIIINTIIRN